MAGTTINGVTSNGIPSTAADAVLKASAPLPASAQKVQGIEFNDFRGKDITVIELVASMANTGFQATAVSDAVRIINDMVGMCILPV